MQGSYVEFSFIEKLHARITEVSPANPGETLNDAVERLIAERDTARDDVQRLVRERNAAEEELAGFNDSLEIARNSRDALRFNLAATNESARLYHDERDAARAEVAALRAALQSLVDGKSEFDIEYDTGMPADEARRIMDLAYNRK